MRFEYVFALSCLGLALFNSVRAWWFWRQQQKVMMVISLCFLGLALVASAYMGFQGWRADQQQAQENAQIAPASR